MLTLIPTIAKSIVAGATALGSTFAVAIAENGVSSSEWVTIVVAVIIAMFAVWRIPNKTTV